MSKASVAQEPSMDEILASIRRIIETGEDRTGATGAAIPFRGGLRPGRMGSPLEMFEGQVPILQDERFASTAGLGEPESGSSKPASVPSAFQDISDAAAVPAERSEMEIAESPLPDHAFEPTAMVSIGSGADEDRLTAELESELAASWNPSEPSHQDLPASAPELGPMSTQTDFHQEPEGTEMMAVGHHEPDNGHAEAMNEPDRSPEIGETVSHIAPAQIAAEAASADEERASFQAANTDQRSAAKSFGRPPQLEGASFQDVPLASDMTGSLVAASFDELAEAIRKGELRSLEAMAQDMLRPMLQDWLDDNLPKMVERLVREEIERMARGGRR